MNIFTAVVFIFGVFLFLGNPEPSYAHGYTERIGDHEEYNPCLGLECSQLTCRQSLRLDSFVPCPLICQSGYSCQKGYIREFSLGRCILLRDCHA